MTTTWLSTRSLPTPELVRLARVGDPMDVDRLARAWLPHVYRWCHRLGGPGFDAEDAAHEVLVTMCRRLDTLADDEAFPSWLFGITRRTLANHRKRAWWRRWLPAVTVEDRASTEPDPEASADRIWATKRVWGALASLSEAHREVLVLVELEERSASEAAALLAIPIGTVKSRLRVAREALAEALGAAPVATTRGGDHGRP
jgi:RNA polymerase sigma-70 factor (ECF subfamily)